MRFTKYHALGNDYLVVGEEELADLTPRPLAALCRRLCDRHRGLGADGVLLGPRAAGPDTWHLRIFNPDGSEAELSGNGLRIMARHLVELGLTSPGRTIRLRTVAGETLAVVLPSRRAVAIELAPASFRSVDVPMLGPIREVIDQPLEVAGRSLAITALSVGNPHCVVFCDQPSAAELAILGPALERHAAFPQRTNVELVAVADRHHLRLEIWERGVGRTLSSGSCSLAAAAAALRRGLVDSPVTVEMPGGRMVVELVADRLRLEGTVSLVAWGEVAPELGGAPDGDPSSPDRPAPEI